MSHCHCKLYPALLLMLWSLFSGSALAADTSQETAWLQYLKKANKSGEMPMLRAHMEDEDQISLTREDLMKLTGQYDEEEELRRSRELNYQADVSESYLQLKFFYQF